MVTQSKLNHALKLLSSLEDMKTRNIVCDYEVRVEGKRFAVHRSVLIACSKYFEGMLTSGMKEARQGFVDMMSLSAEGVEQCIDFMYTGEVQITFDAVRSVIEGSHLIELHDLTKMCLQHLRDNLNVENCLHALDVFKIYGKDDDVRATVRLIIDRLDEVIRSEMFPLIPKQDLIHYLENPAIDPEVHWKATITWMEQNDYKEDDFLVHALDTLLAAREVSTNFLFRVIWCHPAVRSSAKAKYFLLQSLSARTKTIERNLTLETSFVLLEVMQENEFSNKDPLNKYVTKYLARNFEEVKENARFLDITYKALLDILQSTYLCIHKEATKWEAIITWVKKSRSRGKYLPDLMKEINFENLSAKYIHQNIIGQPFVRKSAECTKIIRDVIFQKPLQHIGANFSTQVAVSVSLVMMSDRSGSLIELDLTGGRHNEIGRQRMGGQIVSVSGNLYLLSIISGDVYQLHKTGNWKFRSSQRYCFGPLLRCIAFRNQIYLVGKENMICYDPVENKWKIGFPGCGNNGGFCVAASNDFIYAFGGFPSNRAVRFNSGSSNWTSICTMRESKWVAAATSHRGKIWVAGGVGSKYFSSVECYDPSTNSWETIESMNNKRNSFSLVVHGDELYAVGGACDGRGNRLPEDSIEVYEENIKKWKTVANIDKSEGIISCVSCEASLVQS